MKLLRAAATGKSARHGVSLLRTPAVPSVLILERLYGVPRLPWHARLKQRAQALKRKLRRWLQVESWSAGLAAASVLVVALLLAYYYNDLLILEQNVKAAWAEVEAGQQKRNHVVRNLTAMMRFHTRYEQDLMKDVATLRSETRRKAGGADSTERTGALGRVNMVAEQYPNLQLTNTVQLFTSTVVASESEIASYIIFYNESANIYRTALNTFPTKIFGKILGFHPYPLYTPESPAVLKFKEFTP